MVTFDLVRPQSVRRYILLTAVFTLIPFAICSQKKNQQTVQSPDGKLIATFFLKQGMPCYMLHKGSQTVIDTSQLGYRFKHIPAMDQNFELLEATTDSHNERWTQPWGEEKEIQDHYNQLAIQLINPTENLHLNLIFRAFNDGIGFRYEIPRQTAYNDVEITSEGTEFNFTADHKSWWIPGDPDSYEYLYNETPLSKIDSANTPVTFRANDSLYISIHEAALTNYAGMRLSHDTHQKNRWKRPFSISKTSAFMQSKPVMQVR